MTYTTKLSIAFTIIIAVLVLVCATGFSAANRALANRDRLLDHDQPLVEAADAMMADTHQLASLVRGHLLVPEPANLDRIEAVAQRFAEQVREIERVRQSGPEEQGPLQPLIDDYLRQTRTLMADRTADVPLEVIAGRWQAELKPRREAVLEAVRTLRKEVRDDMAATRRRADAQVALATWANIGATAAAVLATLAAGWWLTASLRRQIGTAIEHVTSSSNELEVTASQQNSSAREQATVTVQVTSASKELLASSRQIAESAQRVAGTADEAAKAIGDGEHAIEETREALQTIHRQVERLVEQMMALGRQTQRIGSVLDIINELTEQTTILAINATIEAVAAGDAGTRFGAVAEEIRKLADRVRGSTQEIHALIDSIRGSANATVLSTEEGSKSVDIGSRRYQAVVAAFARITGLVRASSDSAREIELSTKQQASAVEQVNIAIGEIADAARQAESATRQTQQTATHLARLSGELAKLVRR